MDRQEQIVFSPEGSDALDTMIDRGGGDPSTVVNRAVRLLEELDDYFLKGGRFLIEPADCGAGDELKVFPWP